MAKRERQVFPTDAIPHMWAHQQQHSARNGRNLFYEGDSIYSYGYHYCIARLINNGNAVLFNSNDSSVTTQKQKHDVRRAIPSYTEIFDVPRPRETPESNYPDLIRDYQDAVTALSEAKSKPSKAVKWATVKHQHNKVRNFAEYFELEFTSLFPDNHEEFEEIAEEHKDKVAARRIVLNQQRDERNAERRARWEAERLERLKEAAESLEQWRNDPSKSAYKIQYQAETALRLIEDGKTIQTSRGAVFPASHAKLAIKVIEKVRESGVAWHRNGQQVRLGHYNIDTIEANGDVRAGCHFVKYDEIKLIAAKLCSPSSDTGESDALHTQDNG